MKTTTMMLGLAVLAGTVPGLSAATGGEVDDVKAVIADTSMDFKQLVNELGGLAPHHEVICLGSSCTTSCLLGTCNTCCPTGTTANCGCDLIGEPQCQCI